MKDSMAIRLLEKTLSRDELDCKKDIQQLKLIASVNMTSIETMNQVCVSLKI